MTEIGDACFHSSPISTDQFAVQFKESDLTESFSSLVSRLTPNSPNIVDEQANASSSTNDFASAQLQKPVLDLSDHSDHLNCTEDPNDFESDSDSDFLRDLKLNPSTQICPLLSNTSYKGYGFWLGYQNQPVSQTLRDELRQRVVDGKDEDELKFFDATIQVASKKVNPTSNSDLFSNFEPVKKKKKKKKKKDKKKEKDGTASTVPKPAPPPPSPTTPAVDDTAGTSSNPGAGTNPLVGVKIPKKRAKVVGSFKAENNLVKQLRKDHLRKKERPPPTKKRRGPEDAPAGKKHKAFDVKAGPENPDVTSKFSYSNQWARPTALTKFFQKLRWGVRKEKLGFTGYDWCPDFHVEPGSEWDLLRRKIILPFALINIPFEKGLCEEILVKMVRLCIHNYTSMVVISPYRPYDPVHKAIYNSKKHGYILLLDPISFLRIEDDYSRPGVCPVKIILIFLNFYNSPKLSVHNNLDGIFDANKIPLVDFTPLPNIGLVQPSRHAFQSSDIVKIQNLVSQCQNYETARLKSREMNLLWPELQFNQYRTLNYGFDVCADVFHNSNHPDPLWHKQFPGKTKPRRFKSISYRQYDKACGDDSKIYGSRLDFENHTCTLCGKKGHDRSICWRRIRTSQSMKLVDATDKVLNLFITSLTPCPPLPHITPSDDKIAFILKLQKQILDRANYFSTTWDVFARSRNICPDLVQPGFGQLRQGLPFWFALGVPTFILQWVAFGIPVFWTHARPEPCEVAHDFDHGVPVDSHPEVKKSIFDFVKLGCLLPVRRRHALAICPLFARESGNKIRCIHDLRYVNRFILKLRFTLTTAVNFCRLSLYFCMKIIHNKKPMYFRPNGKTFGESDVPFAITVLVKYVTDVFNRFTICSFWIDDGIIVASVSLLCGCFQTSV